tara:strand:+ start:564 stop:794 length:231 start_codon:yes stop_codon:yes gene_type:complete
LRIGAKFHGIAVRRKKHGVSNQQRAGGYYLNLLRRCKVKKVLRREKSEKLRTADNEACLQVQQGSTVVGITVGGDF